MYTCEQMYQQIKGFGMLLGPSRTILDGCRAKTSKAKHVKHLNILCAHKMYLAQAQQSGKCTEPGT